MGMPAKFPDVGPRNLPVVEPASSDRPKQASEPVDSMADDFSIVVGGPVYDFLLRIGLAHRLPNILRRIVLFVAITWLPLLILALKDGVAFGHKVAIPFLYDFSVYGRLLLGLPILIVAEVVIDPGIRRAVKEFLDAGLIQEGERPKFDSVLRRVQRLRDSTTAELILLLVAFFPVFVFQHEWTVGTISSWHTTSNGLTAAGWWFATLSAPIMRFITYRWAFRYVIWSLLLWRIGRLGLHLIPTHPDRSAGLGFLTVSQRQFGILFAALGCAFAGRVANSMSYEGASLGSFKLLIAGFLVLSVVVGLLPLTMLSLTLRQVRRSGLIEYGRFANRYTEAFDRKWLHGEPPEPLLGTGDIQSLADLGNSFTIVDEMKIAPINRRLIMQLAAQAAAPLIPVIIVGTPTAKLVNTILKMVV